MPYKNRSNPDQYKVESKHKARETDVEATYEYTSGNPTPESRREHKRK
ncbi:MAG TPA: hypothetical protein VFT51_10320 [Bacillales bacterium]|nr:hypothetical protein [Bacillales bacterium]